MQELAGVGRLSRRVAGLKPSGIRKFFDIAATMKDVISLGIGEPDFTTPKPILEAGLRSLEDGETHYTSNHGKLELRQGIANNLKRLYGVKYDPIDEMVVTVGVSEALYLAMTAILDPGDEVIIPTPCFVAYQPEVIMAGGVPVEIPTRMEDNFQVDPARIRDAITPRTKVIFVGYPSNPTGAVASREVLTEIAQIAEDHNLLLISDEIYDRLVYGVEHVCFASLPRMRDRTILLGGFSKAYAMTGWRLAYTCARSELTEAMMKVHQYVMMSAPTPAQFAAIEALKSGEEDVRGMVAEYDRRRQLVVSELNAMALTCAEPKGAFYAFPNIGNSGMNDESFAERLLMEERVAVIPGSAFGEAGAGHVRICYAQRYDLLQEAMDRIHRFVDRHHVNGSGK